MISVYKRFAITRDEQQANAESLLAGFDRLILAAQMAGDQSEVDAISATRARYCGLLAGAGIAAKEAP